MDLSFYKLRVCDADLILVDDLGEGGRNRDWPRAARALLDRRRGAGAERLAVLSRAEESIWLRVWDKHGNRSSLLADAALCAARYLLDSGRSASDAARLRTRYGEIRVDVLDGQSLGLALGPPRALPGGEALDELGLAKHRSIVEGGGERYEVMVLGLAEAGAPGGVAATAQAEGEAAAVAGAADGAVAASAPGAAEAAGSGSAGKQTDEESLATAVVAVICDGGAREARARVGAVGRGASPPPPLPLRVISRGELHVQAPRASSRGGRQGPDACSAAALGLAAAAAAGYADRGAVVRMGDGALWAEWGTQGGLYVVGRPSYAYRGEFHMDEED
jgi:diaminopimelate epimerase